MKTYRGMVIGVGGMGTGWVKTMAACEQVEVVGLVDLVEERAQKAKNEYKLTTAMVLTDSAKALRELKPDFILDATPPEVHHDITLDALSLGIPVIGEKPLAETIDKARAMVRASEKYATLYKVSQNRLYDPNIAAYRALVNATLGTLGILNSDFYLGAHIGGWREQMESPLLFDMAIHTIDAARYISNRDAVSVYCEEFNPSWSWFDGDACATALFEMEGGLRYTYNGSWVSNGRHTTWEANWRAVGEKGSATWDENNKLLAETVTKLDSYLATTELQEAAPVEMPFRGIAASLRDFLNALETGNVPLSECHDNFKSLAMIFAAMESARSGKREKVQTL